MNRLLKSLILAGLIIGPPAYSEDYKADFSGRLSPEDYLYGSHREKRDNIFDRNARVGAQIDLAIGADCGKIDLRASLRAALENLLDADYFENLGQNIVAASPMLAACYLSPTWCAILKNSRLQANYLAKFRLNQCEIIDKFVDSRVEDYYAERQECVHQAIQRNGGNAEAAMESCNGGSMFRKNLGDWAGTGHKKSTNKLLASSAKWADYQGNETRDTLDLIKTVVGDTIVTRGRVKIDLGPGGKFIPPRLHLRELGKATEDKLCRDILRRVVQYRNSRSVDSVVSDRDLKELSGGSEEYLIDRQTLRSLSLMTYKQRTRACQKLSEALARTIFAHKMNKAVEVLTTLSQNPHLPKNRRDELNQKREAFKDAVEMTLKLKDEKDEPLNKVLSQINAEGKAMQSQYTNQKLDSDTNRTQKKRIKSMFMDCMDDLMCEGGN